MRFIPSVANIHITRIIKFYKKDIRNLEQVVDYERGAIIRKFSLKKLQKFEAILMRMKPYLDIDSRKFIVRVDISNGKKFYMSVNQFIILDEKYQFVTPRLEKVKTAIFPSLMGFNN